MSADAEALEHAAQARDLEDADWRYSLEDSRKGDGLWHGYTAADHEAISHDDFEKFVGMVRESGDEIVLIVSDLGIAYRREEPPGLLGYLIDRDPKDDNLFPVQPADKIAAVQFPNPKRYVYLPPPVCAGVAKTQEDFEHFVQGPHDGCGCGDCQKLRAVMNEGNVSDISAITRDIARSG